MNDAQHNNGTIGSQTKQNTDFRSAKEYFHELKTFSEPVINSEITIRIDLVLKFQ